MGTVNYFTYIAYRINNRPPYTSGREIINFVAFK